MNEPATNASSDLEYSVMRDLNLMRVRHHLNFNQQWKSVTNEIPSQLFEHQKTLHTPLNSRSTTFFSV